jgi:small subunit ribosomal protein S20
VANHKSAIKRIRQNAKRAARNRHVRTRMRTVIKAFRSAVESGDVTVARQQLVAAEKSLRGAASKGVIPKSRADRSVGRLAKRLNAMAGS